MDLNGTPKNFGFFPAIFVHFFVRDTIDFSDFWYLTSLIYYFEYGIGSFARKNFFGPKMAKKV